MCVVASRCIYYLFLHQGSCARSGLYAQGADLFSKGCPNSCPNLINTPLRVILDRDRMHMQKIPGAPWCIQERRE